MLITPTEGIVSTAQPSHNSAFGKSQLSESVRNSLTGEVGEVILGPVEYETKTKTEVKKVRKQKSNSVHEELQRKEAEQRMKGM